MENALVERTSAMHSESYYFGIDDGLAGIPMHRICTAVNQACTARLRLVQWSASPTHPDAERRARFCPLGPPGSTELLCGRVKLRHFVCQKVSEHPHPQMPAERASHEPV